MGRTRTAQELIDQARRRANVERAVSKFTNTLMLDFLDSAQTEFHDFVTGYDPEQFVKYDTFTTAAGQDIYSLPADFLHLRRLDLKVGSAYYPINRFTESERSLLSRAGASREIYYSREGDTVVLLPTPAAGQTIRVKYNYFAAKLTGLSDVLEGVNGWEELAVLYMVRRIKVTEGVSTRAVDAEIVRQEDRVRNACYERDGWMPKRLRDRRVSRRRPY